jgi:hypothetical protein
MKNEEVGCEERFCKLTLNIRNLREAMLVPGIANFHKSIKAMLARLQRMRVLEKLSVFDVVRQ